MPAKLDEEDSRLLLRDGGDHNLLLSRSGSASNLKDSKPQHRQGAWVGCAANLLNGTLGPGMLVLPLAFHRTGLVFGSFLVLVIWCFSYLALLLLLDACTSMHTSDLVVLGRAHSMLMSRAIDWSVLLYFYGTCISYLILIGGTLESAAAHPSPATVPVDKHPSQQNH